MNSATLIRSMLAGPFGARANTMLTTAGTVGSLVATFAMRLVLAHTYGPQGLGVYSIAVGYQRVSAQLADLGLHYALLRRASADRLLVRQGLSTKMLLGLVVASTSAIMAGLLTTGDLRLALTAGSLGVFGWSQLDVAQLWFRLRSRFDLDFLLHLSSSVARVLVAAVILFGTGNLAVALVAFFLVPAFASLFVPRPWVRPGVALSLLRDSAWSFIYRTLWLLLLNLDVFVLSAAVGVSALGLYDAPRSLAYAILALADGAFVVILQRLGAGHGDALEQARSITRLVLLLMLLAPVGALVAGPLLPLMFGPAFASGDLAIVFGLLVIAYLAAAGASTYAGALLFARPQTMAALLAAELLVGSVGYWFAARYSVVALAAVVIVVHASNLAILRYVASRHR